MLSLVQDTVISARVLSRAGRTAPPAPKGLRCCAWGRGLLCAAALSAPCCPALQDERDPLSRVCGVVVVPPRNPAPCPGPSPPPLPPRGGTDSHGDPAPLSAFPAGQPQHWRPSARRERRRRKPSRRRSGAWRLSWKPCPRRPTTPRASWSSSARSCSGRSGELAVGAVVPSGPDPGAPPPA